MSDFGDGFPSSKRQKTLVTLRQTTERKLAAMENDYVASLNPDNQGTWYGPEGPFPFAPLQPVARATTPTLEEEHVEQPYFTQMLSSMEIPTFEETLKPLSSAFL